MKLKRKAWSKVILLLIQENEINLKIEGLIAKNERIDKQYRDNLEENIRLKSEVKELKEKLEEENAALLMKQKTMENSKTNNDKIIDLQNQLQSKVNENNVKLSAESVTTLEVQYSM